MTISIHDVPEHAAAASLALREAMLDLLGHDLVAMWLHGGTTFDDRPLRPGDLDVTAVVGSAAPGERRPEEWLGDPGARPSRILALEREIADERAVTFDLACFLEAEMGRDEPPGLAFWARRTRTCWPMDRAHWTAGQYVGLHGKRPEALVVPPSREALLTALDREVEHLERHVLEGDAEDPHEATYAVFNGCRVLHTLETGEAVLSKRSAGAWGLEHLPDRWHRAIRAAGRAYDGVASPEDEAVLRENMAPFVSMVRARLPAAAGRPPGPPRWS